MKAHSLKWAGIAFALCAVIAIATFWETEPSGFYVHADMLAVVTLAALRTQHAELVSRAAATRGTVRDGLAQEEIARIEREHEDLVRQAETVQRQIGELEAAERAASAAAASPAVPSDPREAVRAERVRVGTINDIGTRAGMPADIVRRAVDEGTEVEAFRTAAFEHLASRQPAPASSVSAQNLRDERDTLRDGMRAALTARMRRAAGERNVELPEIGRRYGEMGIVEMAAEAIGWRGHLRTARQADEVLTRAFMSTSDFPGIFGNVINARLLSRYQTATPAYRMFCARYNAVDFRAMNIIRAGDFPTLQRVAETGEIKAGSFSESKETMTVYPYGVTFNLSRQMFVNDNLGAIEQILGSAGQRVVDWENAQAFASLISSSHTGPALVTDGYHVFDATNHANHTSSGTAISVTSIGVGRADMMAQTSLDGLKLNLQPVTLMCGPAPLTVAEQIVTSITPAASSNAVPDWMRRLNVVGDANIDSTHWYLFADPMMAPCWVYGMLEGNEGPRLNTDDPFTIQGVSVKLEHDFGLAAIDYRGAYHNAGA